MWDAEEELEHLGWALGFYNVAGLLGASALLSAACLCAAGLASVGRRLRYVAGSAAARRRRVGSLLCYAAQSSAAQERGSIGAPRLALHFFHRRRT